LVSVILSSTITVVTPADGGIIKASAASKKQMISKLIISRKCLVILPFSFVIVNAFYYNVSWKNMQDFSKK
jgi:hypothetical protein